MDVSFLKKTIRSLEENFAVLADHIQPPVWLPEEQHFRHTLKDDRLLVFLKGVRYISSLNASAILVENGYTQEIGILARCMDESLQDALFFMRGLEANGEASEKQKVAFTDFYQEEFLDSSAGFLENAKRQQVSRDKIRAAISNLPENAVNPHDTAHLHKTTYNAFSGYVHGAYPHIMELYGGKPPHYHMSGLPTSIPHVKAWEERLGDYTYRGCLFGMYAAKKNGLQTIADKFFELRKAMEQKYPRFAEDPVEMVKELKAKDKQPKQ